ncbi:aconitate hydratase AcnA [uncultured Ruegeria sp.]|uniref:aconitate hydratase AcnA n=1 Tax=uncultured Ruegeria sp. TaxID=259304 RepID=UPI002609350A|nr:aconitate hydratase AcnA [uncultured Ruegeria sp.]
MTAATIHLDSGGDMVIPCLEINAGTRRLRATDLPRVLGDRLDRLPFILRLLAENHLRATGQSDALVAALDAWLEGRNDGFELTFMPNRILMHDTTCTPALADIAGLRDAVTEAGGDPGVLSPNLPVNVSVDHSLAVDRHATQAAFTANARKEIARNSERYGFMKWASQNMDGVTVHPPGTGIMHTINLEQLATVLEIGSDGRAHPDMLLGTDSHTPMINGIGVLGWGIGGLEAESVMFGQATTLSMPEVVGVRLTGQLPEGTMPTDLALEVTHRLRVLDVSSSFVEFCGPGLSTLSADARAVIANMAPEYGASTGFFPVDGETVAYLKRTARPCSLTGSIESVFRATGLWFDPDTTPRFDRAVEIDLTTITPTISGPRRPQDTCAPAQASARVETALDRPLSRAPRIEGMVPDGAVGIAAITSCTNTSDPYMMIAAGLLARKARALGLTTPFWVKTSMAPGSPSARDYLQRAGLIPDLSALGFDLVGHGCTTCIGNSGPLPEVIETALKDGKAISAVLSGNRNFPGRVHPKLDLGYLASPPLVVAYALKGDIFGDILNDPIGKGAEGQPIYLRDIWPDISEIKALLKAGYRQADVPAAFAAATHNPAWNRIKVHDSARFPWEATSRYLRRPKFTAEPQQSRLGDYTATPLMVLGDDMTTDHISPAGWVDPTSLAGKWLYARGGDPKDMNVYAAYRGNWEVMLRGLFTNRLAVNFLQEGLAPAETTLEDGRILPLPEAAQILADQGQPTIILAGDRYGMGSSRDWAAKGVALLSIRAVVAKSFERIHRTNLIGMGVVPVQIIDGFDPKTAGIRAGDRFVVNLPPETLVPGLETTLQWQRGTEVLGDIRCKAAVDTFQEVDLLRHGGVLSKILGFTLEGRE